MSDYRVSQLLRADQSARARPVALSVVPSGISADLRKLTRWVTWRYEPEYARDGSVRRWARCPINPTNRMHAKSNNPQTWSVFDTAVRRYEAGGTDGLGFMFAPGDGMAGVDLDRCRNPTSGQLDAWAGDILVELVVATTR